MLTSRNICKSKCCSKIRTLAKKKPIIFKTSVRIMKKKKIETMAGKIFLAIPIQNDKVLLIYSRVSEMGDMIRLICFSKGISGI